MLVLSPENLHDWRLFWLGNQPQIKIQIKQKLEAFMSLRMVCDFEPTASNVCYKWQKANLALLCWIRDSVSRHSSNFPFANTNVDFVWKIFWMYMDEIFLGQKLDTTVLSCREFYISCILYLWKTPLPFGQFSTETSWNITGKSKFPTIAVFGCVLKETKYRVKWRENAYISTKWRSGRKISI